MTGRGLTVEEGLAGLADVLRRAGIANPGREARLILASVLGADPSRMTLHLRDPLDEAALETAHFRCTRRKIGEPLSHILGYRLFYGRRFTVDRRVLDPRPETETLIEQALAEPFSSVLDLGTGSGCILVTLLAERSGASGYGVDLSAEALEVARKNAQSLGVADRCAFASSNWFSAVGGQYDLIVSNPPYIAAQELAGLAPELGHEPRMALTDEGDGLSAYRVIARQAPEFLAPGGRLMVEIGATQGSAVTAMFGEAGFSDVRITPDLDGRDRVVRGVRR